MTDLRGSYEDLERAVCDQVDVGLTHVPDSVDGQIDARLEEPIRTRPPTVATAEPGTAVEIKTCQVVKASGTPGRWIIHGTQHDHLDDVDGIYVLAVLNELSVTRWVIVKPTAIDPLLVWHACPGTPGYDRQAGLRWTKICGHIEWTARGRVGRQPVADGGER